MMLRTYRLVGIKNTTIYVVENDTNNIEIENAATNFYLIKVPSQLFNEETMRTMSTYLKLLVLKQMDRSIMGRLKRWWFNKRLDDTMFITHQIIIINNNN